MSGRESSRKSSLHVAILFVHEVRPFLQVKTNLCLQGRWATYLNTIYNHQALPSKVNFKWSLCVRTLIWVTISFFFKSWRSAGNRETDLKGYLQTRVLALTNQRVALKLSFITPSLPPIPMPWFPPPLPPNLCPRSKFVLPLPAHYQDFHPLPFLKSMPKRKNCPFASWAWKDFVPKMPILDVWVGLHLELQQVYKDNTSPRGYGYLSCSISKWTDLKGGDW